MPGSLALLPGGAAAARVHALGSPLLAINPGIILHAANSCWRSLHWKGTVSTGHTVHTPPLTSPCPQLH